MMSWIIISTLIAGFSAAALKLFGEEPSGAQPAPSFAGEPGRGHLNSRPGFTWEHMTDSELDALVEEYSSSEETLTKKT